MVKNIQVDFSTNREQIRGQLIQLLKKALDASVDEAANTRHDRFMELGTKIGINLAEVKGENTRRSRGAKKEKKYFQNSANSKM